MDIQRAFDQLPRQQLFEHLDSLHDVPALTTLLAQWHTGTSYCVEQAGESVLVETTKGVRQGCRAAPLLWNCFLDRFFRQLASKVSIDWVQKTLTAFADDIHQGTVFKSRQQLMCEISRIGLILDTLESMGLQLSLEKSFILLEIAGTHSRKIRSSLVKQDGAHFFLEIPRSNGQISRIPVKKEADYLGTRLSYSNPEQLTFEKRVQCARIRFHRLKRWLRSPTIGLGHRLQLWRASVVTTLMYGLLAVNLTLPIIKRFQLIIFGMYRQLTRNHSFRTHDSHSTVLTRYGLEHPLMLLLRHAHQLQCRLGQRTQFLHSTDILVHVDWSTIHQNIQLLQVALEVQVPVSPTADSSLEVPHALMYACPMCPFEASTLSNLRRHQTTAHHRTQFRSSLGHAMSCAVNGLPQCTFCFQAFTTWRQFQNHLDRQCCQVRPCDLVTDLDALLREEEEQRILRMHQSLVANILTKPYGEALLDIIRNRDWTALLEQRSACEDLAYQCCVCDFHFSRPQDLHSHLRVHHPKWIPHSFTKGSQLCRGFASNSPCRYCNKSFRQAHSCPILTQIGMLLIHLPPEYDQQEDPPAAALRCETCGLQAATLEEIHGHLATVHRLAFHDWQPERDLMGHDPACNHCATPFASVSAVRQHVTLGQCREFDPNRSPHLLPISPEMQTMMQTGDFQPMLQDPMKRMRMTLHCAQCGVAYSRSNDLMLHLQTAHSAMWNQAQAMTKFLVKALSSIHACVCNPSVNKFTLTHVCPFYRQMAMLATRSSVELFLPWVSDKGSLISLMQRCSMHAACQPVIEAIHARQLTLLLRDPVLQDFLRSHCVLCGGAFHPALLRDHLIQVHASSLTRLSDILPFLYDTFMKVAHTDYQCAQCNQIFNLPLLGDPPLAEKHARQTLVLAHYQQCPVIHQIGHLLLHGFNRLGANDGTRDSGAPGDVRGHGTAPHEAQPKAKRRRKGHQEGQNAASTTGGRAEGGSASGGHAHGQTSHSTGCGAESSEKTRLLRLLHANGAGVGDTHPELSGQELASRDVTGVSDEDPGMEAAARDPDADACGDNAAALPEAVRLQARGSAVSDSNAAQAPECPGGVLLPEMGFGKPATDPD